MERSVAAGRQTHRHTADIALAHEQAEREQRTPEWVAKGKTAKDLLKEFGGI